MKRKYQICLCFNGMKLRRFSGILLAILLMMFIDVTLSVAANPAGIAIDVPRSAKVGDIITVLVSANGASEGLWFETENLTFKRGYFDHCGWCDKSDKPCLVDDEIQLCDTTCGPYHLDCFWSSTGRGHEFSETWFGDSTVEFEVSGCGEAKITPVYLGGSHEGPFTLGTKTIKIIGGVIADFEVPPLVCSGEDVFFENTSCGGETYEWQFGDGSSSIIENPTHIYEESGTYTVRFKVTDKLGSDEVTKDIIVEKECAKIQGRMTFRPDSSPLSDVTVIAGSALTISDNSSSDGTYEIVIPANEPYDLMAQKPGFLDESGPNITLDPDQVYIWNASLMLENVPTTTPDYKLGDKDNLVVDPVNPVSGNYYFSKSLFRFPGRRDLNVNLRLIYNSGAAGKDGPVGYGWTHNYNIYITEDEEETVSLHVGDGHTEYYIYDTETKSYNAIHSHPSLILEKREV